jgi:hypothetical protein
VYHTTHYHIQEDRNPNIHECFPHIRAQGCQLVSALHVFLIKYETLRMGTRSYTHMEEQAELCSLCF